MQNSRSQVARPSVIKPSGGAVASRQLQLLYDVSRHLHSFIDLDQLLPRVIDRTKDLLESEGCSVILLDEAGHELYFPYVSPENSVIAEKLRSLRMPADKGIAGAVVKSGESLRVPDVLADARFYAAVDRETGGNTRSILCCPLRTQRGIIGVIECINKVGQVSFSEQDLTFLEALAGSVAVAIENARLYQVVKRSEARLRDEVALLARERPARGRFADIIGGGEAMERVFRLMESASGSPITVLVQGETGVGKELVARAIHFEGIRGEHPFVAVNCGAFPEALLESELFGYRKGAFTGAMSDKRGLFEAANGGTILLDEIADAPPTTQVKLLRVLERGEFIPLGDSQARHVDVRVVSATNRDLREEVRSGRFREDLFYRLNAFPILVPPLRERREDIPILVAHLLRLLARKWDRPEVCVTPAAIDGLMRYLWPGNVRELEHEIERGLTLAGAGVTLGPEHFSERIFARSLGSGRLRLGGSLKQARDEFEKEFVAEVLAAHEHNVSHSAKALGISRVMLQRKMKQYGLRVAFRSLSR